MTENSLVLGDSNQIVENKNKHYNVEEWKRTFQFASPCWGGSYKRLTQIHIVKIYNVVTFHISHIVGQAFPGPGGKSDNGDIFSEPVTKPIPEGFPPGADRVPQRFLPRVTASDLDGGVEGFFKSFPVPATNNDVGSFGLFAIPNFPKDSPDRYLNGLIRIGWNGSPNGLFTHSDASIQPTSLSWVAQSNLNLDN